MIFEKIKKGIKAFVWEDSSWNRFLYMSLLVLIIFLLATDWRTDGISVLIGFFIWLFVVVPVYLFFAYKRGEQ